MDRKIKYIGEAARWFDRANGNTYHSVRVTRLKDNQVLYCPMEYGYGDQYRHTALEAMAKAKWLPAKYRGRNERGNVNFMSYERENKYPIHWLVSDGLKRDCIANGQA
jgi:hypothetical protein